MRETRDKKINKKVLQKEDIRRVWKIINSQYKYSKDQNNHSSLDLGLDCGDIQYQSESSELLEDGDLIDLKKIESISIQYYDYKLNRRIFVQLRSGNYGSSFMVKGDDRDWVAGIFNQLEVIFEAVKPQDHWFIVYNKIIFHIVAIIFGFLITSIMIKFITPDPNPNMVRDFIYSNNFYVYTSRIVIYWFCGLLPSTIFIYGVNELYPSVEFDFGPEHKKLEKNKRIKLGIFIGFIIVSILLPIFINVVSDRLN